MCEWGEMFVSVYKCVCECVCMNVCMCGCVNGAGRLAEQIYCPHHTTQPAGMLATWSGLWAVSADGGSSGAQESWPSQSSGGQMNQASVNQPTSP